MTPAVLRPRADQGTGLRKAGFRVHTAKRYTCATRAVRPQANTAACRSVTPKLRDRHVGLLRAAHSKTLFCEAEICLTVYAFSCLRV